MDKEIIKVLRAINSSLYSIAQTWIKLVEDVRKSEEVEKTDSPRKD